MCSARFATWSKLALLTLLVGGVGEARAEGTEPELAGLRIVVPDANGGPGDGRGAIIVRLRKELYAGIGGLVSAKELVGAWKKLGIKGPARYGQDGLAKAGKEVGAHFVLYVEVDKRGWLYTAEARLINTETGAVQMNFRSGYYQPQLEAADRGARIARTTLDKLKVLVGEGAVKLEAVAVKPPETDTGETTTTETAIESSDDSRDADIFGSSEDSRDADIFGGGTGGTTSGQSSGGIVSGTAIDQALEQADNRLAIGGQVYLRLQHQSFDEGKFFEDFPLSSPNLFDLFVDARPNKRLRAYAQARLNVNFTRTATSSQQPVSADTASVVLDQLWLNFDISGFGFVSLGRKRIKYGTGRFWNPTDFLNAKVLDPLALFDERTGVDMSMLHVPIESLGWNIYAIGALSEATALSGLGGALRLEMLFGTTEIALTAYSHEDRKLRLGADLSTSIGPLDFHVEAALISGSPNGSKPCGSSAFTDAFLNPVTSSTSVGLTPTTPAAGCVERTRFWKGDLDSGQGIYPSAVDREDQFFPQVVAGVEVEIGYSEFDTIFIGAEYFYNHAGYDDAKLLPWVVLGGDYQPFYFGKHYAVLYITLAKPGDWNDTTFNFSTVGNLSDMSFTSRLDYQVKLLTYLDFDASASVNYGKVGEFRLKLDDAGLGLHSPATIVTVSSGFSVKF